MGDVRTEKIGGDLRIFFNHILSTFSEKETPDQYRRSKLVIDGIKALDDASLGAVAMAIGNMVDQFGVSGFALMLSVGASQHLAATAKPTTPPKPFVASQVCNTARCMILGHHEESCPNYKETS